MSPAMAMHAAWVSLLSTKQTDLAVAPPSSRLGCCDMLLVDVNIYSLLVSASPKTTCGVIQICSSVCRLLITGPTWVCKEQNQMDRADLKSPKWKRFLTMNRKKHMLLEKDFQIRCMKTMEKKLNHGGFWGR
ncbi:hypothetical protein Rs2_15233 [Raphanus sativus]|nr:hypothetical protein Rs2_15233 [Raphanus sativus]